MEDDDLWRMKKKKYLFTSTPMRVSFTNQGSEQLRFSYQAIFAHFFLSNVMYFNELRTTGQTFPQTSSLGIRDFAFLRIRTTHQFTLTRTYLNENNRRFVA